MDSIRRPSRHLKQLLPPLNFITIHYVYFVTTCLLCALILWASSTPAQSLPFVDALFLAVSAMTMAGLNTVNLSSLNTFQQVILFLLLLVGSTIFVSAFIVHLRKARFKKTLAYVVEKRRQRERERERRRSRSQAHRRTFSLNWRSKSRGRDVMVEGGSDSDSSFNTDTSAINKQRSAIASSGQYETRSGKHPVTNANSSEERPSPNAAATQRPGIRFGVSNMFENQNEEISKASTRGHRYGRSNDERTVVPSRSNLNVWRASQSKAVRDGHSLQTPPHSGRYDNQDLDTADGWMSKTSQFHGLTERERERLGGMFCAHCTFETGMLEGPGQFKAPGAFLTSFLCYEYRAIKILAWLVPAYFVLWQLLACLGCAAWVAMNRPDAAQENALNPWWVGAFNAVSAFNNSGMSLLDVNMTAFQTGYYLLITMGLCILAGNTCYPIFLRLIVWTMYKLVKTQTDGSEYWAEHERTLKFLLDHPRRCYTNLFPGRHTWWLLLAVITLNGIDWAAFEILNIGNEKIESLPVGARVLDGLFQALAVRSGGFYVVPMSSVRVGLQVLYVVMMYVSVYPVVITMRNSTVYEEQSLGIYAEDEDDRRHCQDSESPMLWKIFVGRLFTGSARTDSNRNFIRQQLRAQLAHDAWTIVVALFLIMIIESPQFERDPANFSVFNFLFELVSGFGCVGISIGIPWASHSFCGTWHTLSKLILCVVMLRGRHRGLPVAIDRAVLLPGEENEAVAQSERRSRSARPISRGRHADTGTVTGAIV